MAKHVTLENIDHALDGGNMAGIRPRIIYGYQEDVSVWPAAPNGSVTPLSLEDAGELTGDVVMKAGTKAFTFDFTEDVGTHGMAIVGEVDALHVDHTLSLTKAKIVAKILGFMNAAMDRKMFFIVTDENETSYLMGDKNRGASMVAGDGTTTGAGSGDRNQTSLQFKYRARKALVYKGDLEDLLIEVPVS